MPDSPMSPNASIDIMMPFFGGLDLFQAAVRSVLNQEDPEWRLTIIDDCYPDPAPIAWARTLQDPRIILERNPTNLGVSGNFARSVELAQAGFTVIMGCDDVLLPNYIARMRDLTGSFEEASYFQPGVEVIGGLGNVSMPLADRVKKLYRPSSKLPLALSGEAVALSLLRGNWTYFPSIMWRTSVLKAHGFRPDLGVVLDLALQLEIITDGGIMVLDTQPAFQYRRHQSSVSSWMASDGSRFIEERNYFLEVAQLLDERGWLHAAGAARRHVSSRLHAITRVPSALKARDSKGTWALLRHAFIPHTKRSPQE